MTFCEEVRREMDIYWKGSFEYPLILKFADGILPLERLNCNADYTHEQKQHKFKELFTKSCYFKLAFWEMAMTKQSWIPEEVK